MWYARKKLQIKLEIFTRRKGFNGLWKCSTRQNINNVQQLLLELSEQKYISSWTEDNRRYYKLTTEGQSALSSLTNLVQPFIFKRIDSKIKAKKKRVNKQPIIFADYVPEDEDHYLAKCKITEHDNTLIDISISAGSREQAIKYCNVWHNNAPKLYDEIIKLFAKKEK